MFEPRYDLTFSYWLLVWFVLYYNKLVPYNPVMWFWLALIYNVGTMGLMMYYRNSATNIAVYVAINCIKFIPLWILRKSGFYEEDFIFGALLFGAHIWWLSANGLTYHKYMREEVQRIKQDLPVGPTQYYATKLIGHYK